MTRDAALPAAPLALLLAASLAPAAAPAPDRMTGVAVEGTAFVVTLASGERIAGTALAGATLTLRLPGRDAPAQLRLDAIIPDPADPQGDVLLHRIRVLDPAGGPAEELCAAEADGSRWAIPLRGQWNADGARISDQAFTLACAGYAQGKCVRFGYKPWKNADDGTPLAPYHQACIRMVTADYCGGHGTTSDGMLIDYADSLGMQHLSDEREAKDLRFEAAWNTEGAVCVAHPRVPANISLERLHETCPRLRGRLGETVCRPETAPSLGPVLLWNRSR